MKMNKKGGREIGKIMPGRGVTDCEVPSQLPCDALRWQMECTAKVLIFLVLILLDYILEYICQNILEYICQND